MGFVDVVRKAFPFISTVAAIGGPFGTMAAAAVGKALGVDKPDPSEIPSVIASALANPEQRAALLKAEQDFQVQMAELGFKDAESLEQLATEDRESARSREIAVRDRTPELGFYILIGVFVYMVHYLFRFPLPQENRALIFSMAGSIGTLLVGAANYFYGTTRSSENKSTALSSMATTAVENTVTKK